MPETDTIPVSASVASTGLGIRYVGDFCYAFSGKVEIADSKISLLDFFSGAGIIKANMVFNYDAALGGGDNYDFSLDYNEIEIIKIETAQPPVSSGPIIQFRKVIIPPLTHVVISAVNKNGSTVHDCYAMINGRVYGEE